MTREEFKTIEAMLAAYWPSHPIPDAATGAWFEILAGLPVEVAAESVKALYVEGREFPPNAGIILRRALDAAAPVDWDDVLAEIRRKLKDLNRDRRCSYGPLGDVWETPAAGEWTDPQIAELIERSGGVGAWMQRMTIGFPGTSDDTTFLAQQRNVWTAMKERAVRTGDLAAVGARNLAALHAAPRNGPQSVGELAKNFLEEHNPQTATGGRA